MSDREPLPCQSDPDRWHSRRRTVRAEAATACAPCRLRETCYAAALDAGATDGVWGGRDLTEERLQAQRRATLAAEVEAARRSRVPTAS